MSCAVSIESTKSDYSVHARDLPGCVATDKSKSKATRQVQQAIWRHLEGFREGGISIPGPQYSTDIVEV